MALRSFGDGALFAEVLGEGTPHILALHGWGRRGADFRPSLTGLPALAPDLPGFGASPTPTEAIGASGYAEMLAPVLEAVAGRVILVGHSFGGRVALCLAAGHPERVSGMLLTGTPVLRLRPPAPPSFGYRMARLANRAGVLSDRAMEHFRRRVGSADYRTAEGVMRQVLVRVIGESYEAELAGFTGPVRFLWGEEDAEVPLGVAQRALEMREGAGLPASLEVIPGVGHHVPLEAASRLRTEVEEMLE